MAQVTIKEILDASEAVEKVYSDITDELLINIARHFKDNGLTRTGFWEVEKLGELGKLTDESVQIIAKHSKRTPAEIRAAFKMVSDKSLKDIEPMLSKAAQKGALTQPMASEAVASMLREFEAASIDKMNLVNANLLQSARTGYVGAVNKVASQEQILEAQGILNREAGALITNAKTHQRAVRSAINELAAKGLTGFVDRAGRQWSAEAYASMVIRTNAHNIAIDSVRERQKEYGSDIFQVSAHAGARPLCYPWQNMFVSWDSPSGTFTDGDGVEHEFVNINETSYGEPAGLFGINCGHFPQVVIPDFTIPHDMPEQSEEENKKEYEESQQQRAYERSIRNAKRDEEIAKAYGDDEAAEKAAQRVKHAQANMRSFIKETGRTRRYDREQIGG